MIEQKPDISGSGSPFLALFQLTSKNSSMEAKDLEVMLQAKQPLAWPWETGTFHPEQPRI